MSTLVVSLKTSRQGNDVAAVANSAKDGNLVSNQCRQLLKRWEDGIDSGEIQVSYSTSNPVAASATITITHANLAADDAIVVCRQTLTAKDSGATAGTQYNIGADATADAVALAACINANTTLSKYVTATSAEGVVTVTSKMKGAWGNLLSISATDNAFAISNFAGGAGGFDTAPISYSK